VEEEAIFVNHMSRAPRPWPWAHPRCALTWRPSSASLVAIEPFVS